MPGEKRRLRGVVLTEDKRSERFFRQLLRSMGYEPRRFRFESAPSGRGAAEAWVRKRYCREVHVLRSKCYQLDLCLIAVRDGDQAGVEERKAKLDQELADNGQDRRKPDERIATPVPTWSIETWLLRLLGAADLDEETPYKDRFTMEYGDAEREAIRNAVKGWDAADKTSLPSLLDGRKELERINPP
jgi:hypothetical protein